VGELLGIVVPLAAGAAISPTTLALQLFVLSRKTAPLARAWAIAAGYAFVLLVEMVIAFAFAASGPGGDETARPEAWLKLGCAVGLAFLGVVALRRPPKPRKARPESDRPTLGRYFAIGVVLMATNVTTVALYLPAMHHVGVSDVGPLGRALAAVVVLAITLIPAVTPPLAMTLAGDKAREALDRLSDFCSRHSQAINVSVCFGFAIFLFAVSLPVLL
jgi:hypothetical protein